MLRYTTEKDKAYRILDLTSLSIDEFEQLVEPFEQAFVRHMQQWTMEGKPRTARAYTITATRTGSMAQDGCGNLTIDQLGAKSVVSFSTSKYADAAAAVRACWRQ